MDTQDITASDIHAKWVPLYCFNRLQLISRDIDHMYKGGDEWDIDEVMFRRGMGLEASWLATITGWATMWRITINDLRVDADKSLLAAYVRLTEASSGKRSLDDSLFLNDVVWDWEFKLEITDEDKELFPEWQKDFYNVFPPPPEWWHYLQPVGAAGRLSIGNAAKGKLHEAYTRALSYVRDNPDLGQAVVDARLRELLDILDKGERACKELGVDQERQIEVLDGLMALESRNLLETFTAAFPSAPLTAKERAILEKSKPAGGAAAAGTAAADAALDALVGPAAGAASRSSARGLL
ncbi:hypothetical protein PENSPDRAFT_695493 [Peniophora sp. CONT]|nr:hypothetical protein PENSPDRAFT_695493 [Peniophora sp. CONT]